MRLHFLYDHGLLYRWQVIDLPGLFVGANGPGYAARGDGCWPSSVDIRPEPTGADLELLPLDSSFTPPADRAAARLWYP